MANINPIEIFPGINDVPVEATALAGCNGSAIVERVNKLTNYHNDPFSIWGDCNAEVAWYVDTVSGLDTNDGLTELTPFATLQKALSVVEEKRLDDCWWTYIYIKGTVTGEVNFSHIKGWINNLVWEGCLTLSPFPGETSWNWVIGPWTGDGNYTFTPGIRRESINNFILSLENCIFDIQSIADFANMSVYFDTCTFKTTNPTYSCKVLLSGRQYKFSNCIAELTSALVTIYAADAYVQILTPFTLTDQVSHLFIGLDQSFLGVSSYIAVESGNQTISGDVSSVVNFDNANSNYLWDKQINISGFLGKFIFGFYENDYDSYSVIIPSPGIRKYLIAIPNKPSWLKNIALAAPSGTATIQLWGGGNTIGSPFNLTFTGLNNPQWRENLNFRYPYARANSVEVEITAVNGVTDLFVQANLQNIP